MRTVLAIAAIVLISMVAAQKIQIFNQKGPNPVYRCDFNIPNLGAKNESVICEPNRYIGFSFNVSMFVATTSPIGTPDWTIAIYHGSTAPTEVMNPLHQKGQVNLVVNIKSPFVNVITFRNLNSFYAISGIGYLTFTAQ
jgi:hypothetical protein